MLPRKQRSYKSVDYISSRGQIINYPAEFIDSLETTGIVSLNLLLKLGLTIMLLCNLDLHKLCNDTRLTIKSMMPHILEATIMLGKYSEVNCFITRIPMRQTDLPFEFEKLQFPVRLRRFHDNKQIPGTISES